MKKIYSKLKKVSILLCLLSYGVNAQVVNTESFDGTTFLPTGWSFVGTPTAIWGRVTSGSNPTQAPNSAPESTEKKP